MDILSWFRPKPRPVERAERKAVLRPVATAPRIWAIGGGKGGVGKTLVASSMGVLLASCGKRVLVVDADFGAANLHTFFGVQGAKRSLSNFLKGEVLHFTDTVVDSGITNLSLVCGEKDSLDVADLSDKGVALLRGALRNVPFDYVLLDIGPGTTASHLDLFLTAQTGVIVTSSEPTSVENSYRFLKCLFLRRMKNAANGAGNSALKDALHGLFSGHWTQRVKTISDILQQLRLADPVNGALLDELMGGMSVGIIVNNANGAASPGFGASMERACADYFGVGIRHLGDIARDGAVPESVRLRRPLLVHSPQSEAARALKDCFTRITSSEWPQARPGEKGAVVV